MLLVRKSLTVFLATFFLTSCGKKSNSSPVAGGGSGSGGGSAVHVVQPNATGTLCYQGTIQTIIKNNCLACHGTNPMAFPQLTTYNQVVAVKGNAKSDIERNLMPPGGSFTSASDKQDLITWLGMTNPPDACNNPTPTPTPTATPTPSPTKTPTPSPTPTNSPNPTPTPTKTPTPSPTPTPSTGPLTHVDYQVLTMPIVLQPDELGDVMFTEIVPTGLDPKKNYYISGMQVEAIEADTGKPSPLLHHLLVMKGPANGQAKQTMSNMSEMTGMNSMQKFLGSTFVNKLATKLISGPFNLYGGYVKGNSAFVLPTGVGQVLKGSDSLSLSVHYNTLFALPTTNKNVRMRISFQFEKSIQHVGYISLQVNPTWILSPMTMMLPAGQTTSHNYTVDPWEWVSSPSQQLDYLGVLYHMHSWGTAGKTTLISGTKMTVLNEDKNFSYANQYFRNFPQAVTLKKGDKINTQCTWNNSQENQPYINGQQLQAQDLMWGEGSLDEMCMWIALYVEKGTAGLPTTAGGKDK